VEKTRSGLKVADLVSADGEDLDALLFRTRVAVLWVAVAVALSGSFVLYMVEPGAIEEMLAGTMEGWRCC
jgi:hypothetical protein